MFEIASGVDLRVEGETFVSTEAICAVPAAVSDGVEKSAGMGESVCTLEFEWEISGSGARELTTIAGGFSLLPESVELLAFAAKLRQRLN